MNKYATSILFICLNTLLALGQPSKKTFVKGYYVLQDSGKISSNDCVFCDPETMPDRIILDSTYRMVARKINTAFGYTYYEWRNTNYTKSFQEIYVSKYNFLESCSLTNEGNICAPEKNNNKSSHIAFELESFNKKKPYNGIWKAKTIKIQVDKKASDSILKLYHVPKAKISDKTKIWDVIKINENGQIKSAGLQISGIKETQENAPSPFKDRQPNYYYKIGFWQYYNDLGKKTFKENIKEIRKDLEG